MTTALEHIAATGDIEAVKQVDPWAWVHYNNLILNAGPYQVKGHEFQIDIFQCEARAQCAKKSPQFAGFTEILVCRTLHSMIHRRYKQGAMYLFPTADEVSAFSKSRFKPFLTKNFSAVGRHIRETDSTEVKQIGDAFLFFRAGRMNQKIEGSQKSSSKLKSVPCDCLICDEYDEMDMSAVELAKGRMDHSEIKEEWYLANPTVPDFGIDALYQKSDQRVWAIKCGHCGKYTCLELEFPNCLKRRKDGSVFRGCKKCGREIFPIDGQWIAQRPSLSDVMVGWWISHLNSAYTDPRVILDEFEDPKTDMVAFHNRRLGMAYIAAENRLTVNQVYACCGHDVIPSRHDGPCGMGVDVGKNLHVSIGTAPYKGRVKLLKSIELSSFNDVMDLAKKFNVRCAVFDLNPETRKVREYRASVSYPVYGCSYSEFQKGAFAWNESDGVVTVNRTEICDTTHDLFDAKRPLIELPRRCDEVEQYALQLTQIAKVLEEKAETGSKVYRYRKLGADHYRHSLNYLYLALLRVQGSYSKPAGQQENQEYYYG